MKLGLISDWWQNNLLVCPIHLHDTTENFTAYIIHELLNLEYFIREENPEKCKCAQRANFWIKCCEICRVAANLHVFAPFSIKKWKFSQDDIHLQSPNYFLSPIEIKNIHLPIVFCPTSPISQILIWGSSPISQFNVMGPKHVCKSFKLSYSHIYWLDFQIYFTNDITVFNLNSNVVL